MFHKLAITDFIIRQVLYALILVDTLFILLSQKQVICSFEHLIIREEIKLAVPIGSYYRKAKVTPIFAKKFFGG